MPRQLVFASVPAGLAPGRSGYCTAARSPGLRDRLVRELELAGAHEVGEGEAFAFNLLRLGGDTFAVLTRYGDAGPDYTGRASTIAHHLVFESSEIAGMPPPADVARRFDGWVRRWEGPARTLPDVFLPHLAGAAAKLPAETWKRLAGDAGKAALFCDDAGRAKKSSPPDVGPETLALLAEASLLLEDKGWTTPFTTRRREPDAWAVWHTAPADPAALPDPGRAPRATLARAGAMAAAVPGFAAAGVPKGGRPTRAAGPSAAAPAVNRTLLFTATGITTAAVVAAVAFLLSRGSSTEPTGETAPRPPAETPRAPAKTVPPKVAEALAAIRDDDPARAAAAWLELKAADPAAAEENKAAILPPVRRRLAGAAIERSARELDATTAPLPAETSERIRNRVTETRRLMRETGADYAPGESAALDAVLAKVALREKASEALPERTIAEVAWTKDDETELSTGGVADCGETPSLREFLSAPHAKLEVRIAPFSGFDAAEKPVATAVADAARDYSPGRALTATDGANGRLVTLLFDTRGRLSVKRRHPKAAPSSYAFLDEAAPMAVTIVDTASGKSHTLVLLAGNVRVRPLRLPAAALVERDGVVAPENWLAGLIAGRVHALSRPSLQPAGYKALPRDFPGLDASRAVVEQSLRARLETAPAGARDDLRAAVAKLPAGLAAAGAPWRVVVIPAGGDTPRTIIEFQAP